MIFLVEKRVGDLLLEMGGFFEEMGTTRRFKGRCVCFRWGGKDGREGAMIWGRASVRRVKRYWEMKVFLEMSESDVVRSRNEYGFLSGMSFSFRSKRVFG